MAQLGHWQTTAEEIDPPDLASEPAIPCLVVIFSSGKPACEPIRIGPQPITIGRAKGDGVYVIDDDRASRLHTQVTLCPEGVRVTDLDSRNGTFVDGERVRDQVFPALPRLLRVGHTLLRFAPRVDPFIGARVQRVNGAVVGPILQESRQKIARAAATGGSVLLTGPSGSGKELAAQVFHSVTGRSGPFIAVNCAAIPAGLAERLLFGARRGAYSGADADADGYVQAADGGTLFLDEIAELDPSVQPKLLRVLESREVLALGASRARPINIRFCGATMKDLRAEVAAGRFREDLYFRIGRPEVRLPGLVERLEELPWLACDELERADARLAPSALLLEACVLRSWPGNVRELLLELGQAARVALDAGRTVVEAKDLSPSAGQAISVEPHISTTSILSREVIEAALRREQGNVTGAARSLGIHRNQLRRWIASHGVPPAPGEPTPDKTDPEDSPDKTR